MKHSSAATLFPIGSRTYVVPDSGHRRYIDGLRALAALSVIAVHTAPQFLPGGGAGVFFVLSGFLISGVIVRGLVQGAFSFSNFYSRRILRIFPSLIVVLVTVWAVGGIFLLPDEYRRLGKDVATAATFTLYNFWWSETNLSFDIDLGGNFLTQLWSLGVEEQFYLIWPISLLLIYKFSKAKVSYVAIGIAMMTIGSFSMLALSDRLSRGLSLVPWLGIYQLSIGGLLSVVQIGDFPAVRLLTSRIRNIPNVGSRICNENFVSAVAAVLLLYSILSDPAKELFPYSHYTGAPTVGTLLLLASGPQSFVGRKLFGSDGMVFFGIRTYPLYLWHFPVLFLVFAITWGHTPSQLSMFVIVLLISTVLASLTYKYIESPIRCGPRRASTFAILIGGMLFCGLIGVATFDGAIRPVSYFSRGDLALPTSEDWLLGSGGHSWTQFQEGPLILGNGVPHVLFMGDSNMQQYYPRVKELLSNGKVAQYQAAVFLTRYGCVPGAGIDLGTSDPDLSGCGKFTRDAIAYAERPNIDTVVIAGCWYGGYSDWGYYFDHGDRGPLRSSIDAELRGLTGMMDGLVRSGKHVYLILNIPVGKGLDPRARAYWYGETPVAVTKGEVAASLEPVDSKLRRIAKEASASVIDPLEFLCDTTQCPAVSNEGKSIYHDMWHLRPSYVRDKVTFLDKLLHEQ